MIPTNSIEKREQITKLLKIWERFTFMSQEEDWALQRENDARAGTEGAQENCGGQEAADFPKLEKMTRSSVLAWGILWTGEPGGPQSTGLQRVRHDWSDLAQHKNFFTENCWKTRLIMCGYVSERIFQECLKKSVFQSSTKSLWAAKNYHPSTRRKTERYEYIIK